MKKKSVRTERGTMNPDYANSRRISASLYWLPSEIALIVVSLTSLLLFSRIFQDRSYFVPTAIVTVATHLSLIILRRLRANLVIRLIVSTIAGVIAIGVVFYRQTLSYGVVPGTWTLAALGADLETGLKVFVENETPVPVILGLVVPLAAAMVLVANLADLFAFSGRSPAQALIGHVALLSTVALLGTQEDRVPSVLPLLSAGIAFLLLHRGADSALFKNWNNKTGQRSAYTISVIFGVLFAVLSVFAGYKYGPTLPGADAEPLIELGDKARRDNRPLEVVSPMVEIRPKLLDSTNEVIFNVDSPKRSYWRIASLDLFDGQLWRSQGQFNIADGKLDVAYRSEVDHELFQQHYVLASMNSVWVPAAYLPTELNNSGASGINYEAESATFIVDTKSQDLSNGLSYSVTSAYSTFTAEQLNAFAQRKQSVVDGRYLALPSALSPSVIQQAREITDSGTNRYQKALALQDFFLSNFTYDLDVAHGHNISRIEDFLTVRRGYCEQFAGSYAAMARAVGIPSRVAIGFTTGDANPDRADSYIVRGKHAHAWVEVFIDGAGWVAFDPTPGRGLPGAQDYTGQPENQDSDSTPQPTPTAVPPPPEQQETPDQPAQQEPPPPPAAPTPTPEQIETEPESESAQQVEEEKFDTSWLWALLALTLILGWAFGIPYLNKRREDQLAELREKQYRLRCTQAWALCARTLAKTDTSARSNETIVEYAERIGETKPELRKELGQLAKLVTAAAYAAKEPSQDSAIGCEKLCESIHKKLAKPVSSRFSLYDPRPLLGWQSSTDKYAQSLAQGAKNAAS